jgi:hypothetical protein
LNRFILDENPRTAAEYHCDKHVVKMILEESQMLSTAHRILDGAEFVGQSKSGRKAKRWKLDDSRDDILYQATHVNHPCTQWSMFTSENYVWSVSLLRCLLDEYQYRYGKQHKCETLYNTLRFLPQMIANGKRSQFPQAMPDDCKRDNPVDGYRKYYIDHKVRFAKWTGRPVPEWFTCSSNSQTHPVIMPAKLSGSM